MRALLSALFIASVLTSCAPDEPLIDNFDDSWRILAAGSNGGLALIGMPDGVMLEADVMQRATGSAARVYSHTVRFRDQVFVLHAQEPTLTVLSADSLRRQAVVDFGAAGPASSIAFANATTAFATHPSNNLVSVIDLTTYTVADTISVQGRPIAIAIIGNQACVASQKSAEIRFIDTRSFQVSAPLTVPPAPTFVTADATNDAFIVVSLGSGKIDTGTASVPVASFAGLETRSIVASVALTPRAGQGAERLPVDVALTDDGFVYVAMSDVLLRVPARSRSRATLVSDVSAGALSAVPTRAEILVASPTTPTVDVYDGFAESRRATAGLPFTARSMLALTP